MIVALLGLVALLFLGGNVASTLTGVEKSAKHHVPDKARRETILDAGKQLEKELKSMEKRLNTHFTELVKVHQTYGSVGADFDAITAKLKEDQSATAKAILDARETMREQMTREEWTAVFASAKK